MKLCRSCVWQEGLLVISITWTDKTLIAATENMISNTRRKAKKRWVLSREHHDSPVLCPYLDQLHVWLMAQFLELLIYLPSKFLLWVHIVLTFFELLKNLLAFLFCFL